MFAALNVKFVCTLVQLEVATPNFSQSITETKKTIRFKQKKTRVVDSETCIYTQRSFSFFFAFNFKVAVTKAYNT